MVDINITDSAISKIQEVLKGQNKNFFRIKVKGGGCSGFQYIFKTDSEYSEEKDNIYKLKEIDIVIDKKSLPFIKDSELDYKNELVGSSFSISNPNAKNSCGCGSSFSI